MKSLVYDKVDRSIPKPIFPSLSGFFLFSNHFVTVGINRSNFKKWLSTSIGVTMAETYSADI